MLDEYNLLLAIRLTTIKSFEVNLGVTDKKKEDESGNSKNA
jgi:hypothetical protein